MAIEKNGAVMGIIEASCQSGNGRFATARQADDSGVFASGARERYILQYSLVRAGRVGKGDVLEVDASSRCARKLLTSFRNGVYGRLMLDVLSDALKSSRGAAEKRQEWCDLTQDDASWERRM
jgi:hypothetical protein